MCFSDCSLSVGCPVASCKVTRRFGWLWVQICLKGLATQYRVFGSRVKQQITVKTDIWGNCCWFIFLLGTTRWLLCTIASFQRCEILLFSSLLSEDGVGADHQS